MIRVVLPPHLRTLARVDGDVAVDVNSTVTQRAILDELETRYPMLRGTMRDHVTQLRDQQVKLVEQSKRMQAGLQKFARDLIELGKTDTDAKAIVDKYGISMNSPAPGAPAAPASPAATP